jgi:hypothetical protein
MVRYIDSGEISNLENLVKTEVVAKPGKSRYFPNRMSDYNKTHNFRISLTRSTK